MEQLNICDRFTLISPNVNEGDPTPVIVTGRAGSKYKVKELAGDGSWWLSPDSFAIEGLDDE